MDLPQLPAAAELVEASWPAIKTAILSDGWDANELQKQEAGLKHILTIFIQAVVPQIAEHFAQGVESSALIARTYANACSKSTETAQACQTATLLAVECEEFAAKLRASIHPTEGEAV